MEWLLTNWQMLLTVVLAVIGGASVVVKAVAPLTNTTVDDKLGGALTWLYNLLSRIALNPSNPDV